MLQRKLGADKLKKQTNKKKNLYPLIPIKKKILEEREHQDLVPS